jgi:hypothetical protein
MLELEGEIAFSRIPERKEAQDDEGSERQTGRDLGGERAVPQPALLCTEKYLTEQ